MNNVIISVSVALEAVSGSLVEPVHLSEVEKLPRIECRGTTESKITRFLDEVMSSEGFAEKEKHPAAICVSMKGDPNEPLEVVGAGLKRGASSRDEVAVKRRNVGGIAVDVAEEEAVDDSEPSGPLLKDVISERYHLPVFVLNRFQAFSLGAYHIFGEQFARSFACVNLASEVGCGIVLRGELKERYDRNGSGGLREICRKSNRDTDKSKRTERIVSIAGSRALRKAASWLHISVPELLDRGIKGDAEEETAVVDDVVDAVAQLILYSASHWEREDIPHVAVNVYNREFTLPKATKEGFIKLLQREVNRNSGREHFTFINLFDVPLSDEDIKIIGSSRYAAEQLKLFTPPACDFMSENVFAVTGLPASGKTTFLQALYDNLERGGKSVGGVLSREERGSKGGRTGFEMVLCSSGQRSETKELAVIKGREGRHRDDYESFSRYSVNTYNVRNSVVPFVWSTMASKDFVIIDEVANMQLFSPAFQKMIETVITGGKKLVISVPLNSKPGMLSTKIREEADKKGRLLVLDPKDKVASQDKAMKQLLSFLGVAEEETKKDK